MASRRSYRNLKRNCEKDYNILKLHDVLCPICRSILIEPVTLPCNHTFCLSCFTGTVENANLECPLCRTRIGSWLRRTKKESKLINDELWQAINLNYAKHVKNKLDGIDENLEEESRIVVSLPGEIRKEYEIQKQKEDEELTKKRQAEEKASEELIRKLKEEEENENTVIKKKLQEDEQIAKKIAAELMLTSPSTSKTNSFLNSSYSSSVKHLGPMDKFLKRDNETFTSQTFKRNNKSPKEKEFTVRMLCLDRKSDNCSPQQTFSPIIKKKFLQLQGCTQNDSLNDSFECLDINFKPIDRVGQTHYKSPVRLPVKRQYKEAWPNIIPPIGIMKFQSDRPKSAFATLAPSPDTSSNNTSSSKTALEIPFCTTFKRKQSSTVTSTETQNKKLKVKAEESSTPQRFPEKRNSLKHVDLDSPPFCGFNFNLSKEKSKESVKKPYMERDLSHTNMQTTPLKRYNSQTTPTKGNSQMTPRNNNLRTTPAASISSRTPTKSHTQMTPTKSTNCRATKGNTQVTPTRSKRKTSPIGNNLQITPTKTSSQTTPSTPKRNTENSRRRNGYIWSDHEDLHNDKLLQEKADYELAKKLQAEMDDYQHNTRSTRKVGRRSIRRQTTLDEILTGPYRVK